MYTTWRRRNEVQKSRSPEVQKSRSPEVYNSEVQQSEKMEDEKIIFFLPSPPILVLPISVLFHCIVLY